jgi:hypothetical protein
MSHQMQLDEKGIVWAFYGKVTAEDLFNSQATRDCNQFCVTAYH